MSSCDKLVRENIRSLVPYSSARAEFVLTESGQEDLILLDANENAWGSAFGQQLNRYPDPLQRELKHKLAALTQISEEMIFIGNGSDEAIELLIKIFCNPGVDNVISTPPTYGMYQVAADLHQIEMRLAPLGSDFNLEADRVLARVDARTKLIFLCSPNNPTANLLDAAQLERILAECPCIVVVDEAYIDYSPQASTLPLLAHYRNLVVLQTFSKAWGLAGARVGKVFARAEVIAYLNRVKPPYNVSTLNIQAALNALMDQEFIRSTIKRTLAERERVYRQLETISGVKNVYRSDANFYLVRVENVDSLYQYLLSRKIVVRNRNSVPECQGCLRIAVGDTNQNDQLLAAVREFYGSKAAIVKAAASISQVHIQARTATVCRRTNETQIQVELDLDGHGLTNIQTGLGFFNHMLDQLGRHAGVNLQVSALGDLGVDEHHTIEDVAIALGEAFGAALGSKVGIERYGFVALMDESVAEVAIDLSGRAAFVWQVHFERERIGDMPTEMFSHFFKSFSGSLRAAIHVRSNGENEHHKIEACFKALGRALKQALRTEPGVNSVPSTKGVL